MLTRDKIRTEKYSITELIRDYDIHEGIGVDSLSAAFKATDKRTGERVTLLFLYRLIDVVSDREDFIQLVTAVSRLRHPLILPIKKACIPLDFSNPPFPITISDIPNISQFNTCSIITTDNIENGQLSIHTRRYLRSEGRLHSKMNPTIRSKVIFGIACLMEYLHSLNMHAYTLKFEKIYLNEKFEPVFINIGFDYYGPVTKDVEYIPPFNTIDSFKGEVFQFAIVVYKMFSLNELVVNKRTVDLNYIFKIKNGWRPEKPDLMPVSYWKLVCRCWDHIDDNRPSFAEIVKILQNEKFAIDEFGMKTDRVDLHNYQLRVKNKHV